MISPYPFFGFPSFRRPYPYYRVHTPYSHMKNSMENASFPSHFSHEHEKRNPSPSSSFGKSQTENLCHLPPSDGEKEREDCFEFLGLTLYFDDLLLIALLFFLYQEDVKDVYLYVALILLLLS